MPSSNPNLAPRVVVDAGDGQRALDFYATAFEVEPCDQMFIEGKLVNAHVPLGDTLMGLAEGDGVMNMSPGDVGGTPVLLSVTLDDVDAVAARFVDAGGEVVIGLDDRPYGRRDGRFRDPFGHLWILGQEL